MLCLTAHYLRNTGPGCSGGLISAKSVAHFMDYHRLLPFRDDDERLSVAEFVRGNRQLLQLNDAEARRMPHARRRIHDSPRWSAPPCMGADQTSRLHATYTCAKVQPHRWSRIGIRQLAISNRRIPVLPISCQRHYLSVCWVIASVNDRTLDIENPETQVTSASGAVFGAQGAMMHAARAHGRCYRAPLCKILSMCSRLFLKVVSW